jgi:hypothetical protein
MHLQWTDLEERDKKLFDKYFLKYPPKASEFTFTNLFSWRFKYDYKYAFMDEHLLIKVTKLLQPVGKEPWGVIERLLKENPDLEFEMVEEKIALKIPGVTIEEKREMFDYVYSIDDLRKLEGTKYAAKRNFVNQFAKYNPEVCILDEETVHSFFSLQEKWCNLQKCEDNKELAAEDMAVREAISHFKGFNLFGLCIKINGNVEGFAIGERLNNNTFVEHFEKANTSFRGIYQYLLHEFVKMIPEQFQYLNREQDLGIEGIRKSKLSYHPVRMIKKCRISARI